MASKKRIVDLRSDTVTRPSPGMREAIAKAEVGDDMFGEDPTVHPLEEETAALLGTEAALFVPTGAMANQIAIKAQTQPGDGLLVGVDAHNWMYEAGAAGFISSVQITVLPGDGTFDAKALREGYREDNSHYAPTRLVSVENTLNTGGGLVWPQGQVRGVLAESKKLGAGFDTVSVCLSKGLGAPVGSLLCSNRDLIRHARRLRRILGGQMRQAGIIAAGGLYALRNNRKRLVVDHENAALLAREIDRLPGLSVDLERVHSNIVMVDVAGDMDATDVDAHALRKRAAKSGLLFLCVNARRFRLVTHLDVNREDCMLALETLEKCRRVAGDNRLGERT